MATIQPIKPTKQLFDAHLACFEALLQRNLPFYIMFDVRKAIPIDMALLQKQSAFQVEQESRIVQNLVCSSVVCNSPMIKMLLDALFAWRKPKKVNKRFLNPGDAKEWMQTEWNKVFPPKFFWEQ